MLTSLERRRYVSAMELMPIGIRISGLPVLMVGGGPVALRKIRLLLKYGAKILLVSPIVQPALRRLAASKKLTWRRKCYSTRDLSSKKHVLAIACTHSAEVNQAVARDAKKFGAWVNRADCPSGSTVHVPSIARIGGLTLALFSGGRAPVYVKHIRRRLERELGPKLKMEMSVLARARADIQKRVALPARRKIILNHLLKDGLLSRLAAMPAAERASRVRLLIQSLDR